MQTCNTSLQSCEAALTTCQSELAGPRGISALVLWFDPDRITGVADGGLVPLWPDSSGNHFDAMQPEQAKQPHYRAARANGHASVDFDGQTQVLDLTGTRAPLNNITMFVVYRYRAGVGSDCQHTYPFGLGGSANVLGTYYGIETLNPCGGGSVDEADIYAGFSCDARAVYPGISQAGALHLLSAVTPGRILLTKVWVDGHAATMTVDGGCDATMAVPISGTFGSQFAGIGGSSFPGDNKFTDGEVFEVLVYETALSDADRANVEGYLKSKYAIP